ncbi:DUF4422 domain-containing protein [Bifidobacterium sp. 82T10]|uniref:DUF4422 domain-containing protein n=1 Tax=Bifidobacterium miconis TaxID=2834435 RepID=A0ABS6WI52_9BIFI|nr:DUF4422 domain-containing protein [Bifidobacterium miconis]MBW3093430.1 DUF4422 domain-containing protein [Bifidobacterium miconis]
MNTDVYIISHKDYDFPKMKSYFTVLAGANKNSANLMYTDNVGDNISDLNYRYCELTAQYWVWKNIINSNNVGFVHYRRFFYQNPLSKKIVSTSQFSSDLSEYDIILPEPHYLKLTVRDHYKKYHHIDDLNRIGNIISEISPKYLTSYTDLMNRHGICLYNMFISRRYVFDEYMTWLFSILKSFTQASDVSHYSAYNQRLEGFLSERLLNVWVGANDFKVKYYPVFVNDENHFIETANNMCKRLIFRS